MFEIHENNRPVKFPDPRPICGYDPVLWRVLTNDDLSDSTVKSDKVRLSLLPRFTEVAAASNAI